MATLKKVLGPMETEGISIESKMMPNRQSMMLSHEIINKAWSVQLSVEANMLNADGSEACSTFPAGSAGEPNVVCSSGFGGRYSQGVGGYKDWPVYFEGEKAWL